MAHEIFFEDITVGMEMPKLVKGPMHKLQHVIYAGASGDFNPLHTERRLRQGGGHAQGRIATAVVMGLRGTGHHDLDPKKHLKLFGVRFAA
jgi:acyl dehydratase